MLGAFALGQFALGGLLVADLTPRVDVAATIAIQLALSADLTIESQSSIGISTFSAGIVDQPANLLIAANNARAVLAAPLSASDAAPFNVTLTGDLSKFSASGAITIDVATATVNSSEILYYDEISGQNLTIVARAQDGTTAKSFAAGAVVQERYIARHHNLLAQTLIDVEAEVLEHGTAIDGKADAVHTHAIADTTGLQPALDAKLPLAGGTLTGLLTLSGAPTTNLHAATKLYVDSMLPTSYNVKAYGCAGDGATDDTSALQTLLNTVGTAGGGRIYFPKGVYIIAGPLTGTGIGVAQIHLPLRDDSDSPITIEFFGDTTPATWLFEGGPPQGTGYSIIKSTLTSAGMGDGSGALIGGLKHSGSTLANNVMANFKDLIFEVLPNPKLSAINLINQTGNRIERVLIHDGSITESHNEPTNVNAYGIKLSPTNQSSRIWLDNAHCIGFYTGLLLGELTQGSFVAQGCKRAVEIPWGHHPSWLEFLGSYGCPYDIVASGTGERALKVQMLSLQNDVGYAQAWQGRVYNVDDPSNLIRGSFEWFNVQANVGVVHSLVKNGGVNFIGTELW
jgi:hypothetical protein